MCHSAKDSEKKIKIIYNEKGILLDHANLTNAINTTSNLN